MTLAYLDEVGFSPSQPVNARWTLPGQRKLIPYENPRGRRLNTRAALFPDSPTPSLWWGAVPHSRTSEPRSTCWCLSAPSLAWGRRWWSCSTMPRFTASIPISRVVQEARPALAAEGITLDYLPPSSPKLNVIEPYFGALKYPDLSDRDLSDRGLSDRTYPNLSHAGRP